MLERAKERTAAEFGVVQAVLQRPAALPLPSAGANLRRVRPVTAGTSGAYLLLYYIRYKRNLGGTVELYASSLL